MNIPPDMFGNDDFSRLGKLKRKAEKDKLASARKAAETFKKLKAKRKKKK